ncbi:rod shape-determining protein MreC [Stenoxybacter acetivorans]|uniref:rod shape-determining protein MreC n=1 Tax=Stenoxybacter acetivorans TaxID=422441 RepID=UPI0005601987|nr:rod shape-determining protein MreC [Stenoxybacter acetivorans]
MYNNDSSPSFANPRLRPASKLVFLALAAVVLLLLDHRYAPIARAKSVVATALYPLQWLANQPINGVRRGVAFLQNQHHLLAENQRLHEENAQWAQRWHLQQAQLQALTHLDAIQHLKNQALPNSIVAKVISVGSNTDSDLLVINQGSQNGITAGDPVTDEHGLIGQITAVQPFNAEITLVTSNRTVIPAMVARTGVRTLVYGNSNSIDLPYFPADASLKTDDLLITSGVDSIYPAGIPIAQIISAETGNGSPYYRVELRPASDSRRSQFVLILPQTKHSEPSVEPKPQTASEVRL